MVQLKTLGLLSLAAGLTCALPSSNVDSRTLQHDQTGEALLQKRAPLELFQSRLRKRDASPVVDYNQLAAGSTEQGGQNYTGYMNPVAGTFVKNPHYAAFSAFDFHSLNLATHQEYIELDLFNYMISRFSVEEFREAGLNEEDISLLRFFGQQEIGHAQVLSNVLGPHAPKQCQYQYPFNTVREALLFTEELTRYGESGVYGFLPSLDNRANSQILLQSIATEARQQYTFRQWLGVFPVPVWFETGIPQAWAWTLLSPHIKSCPSHNTPVGFGIFPKLTVRNQPDLIQAGQDAGGAAISHNTSALSYPGKTVRFSWDGPGQTQGPYNQKTSVLASDDTPRYVAWVNQYNVTYSDLNNVEKNSNGSYTGTTKLPSGDIFPQNGTQSVINGTVFAAITNSDTYYTPLNLTLINGATIAGPALYQSG